MHEIVVGWVWADNAHGEVKVFFKAVRTILIHFVTVTLPLILSWYFIDKLLTMYVIVGFIKLDTLSSQCIWEAQKSCISHFAFTFISFFPDIERKESVRQIVWTWVSAVRQEMLVLLKIRPKILVSKYMSKNLILDSAYGAIDLCDWLKPCKGLTVNLRDFWSPKASLLKSCFSRVFHANQSSDTS